MQNKKMAWYVILVVVAVVAFFIGMNYGKRSITATNMVRLDGANRSAQFGGANGGSRGMIGGFTTGSIIAKDAQSITVKLANGGSKIVFFSTGTNIQKTVAGTVTELTLGEEVSVAGAANADGSVNAQSIQIRPTGTPIR